MNISKIDFAIVGADYNCNYIKYHIDIAGTVFPYLIPKDKLGKLNPDDIADVQRLISIGKSYINAHEDVLYDIQVNHALIKAFDCACEKNFGHKPLLNLIVVYGNLREEQGKMLISNKLPVPGNLDAVSELYGQLSLS